MAGDQAAIRDLMSAWGRASGEGKVRELLEMLADDVVFLTPGNAPMGKEQFEAGFRKFSAKAHIETQQDVLELRVAGNFAYALSHLKVTMTPKAGGAPLVTQGHVLTIFRKANGRWRLARDANLMSQAGNPDKIK
jgi:uncharacterized protein (TIGR02246 family)